MQKVTECTKYLTRILQNYRHLHNWCKWHHEVYNLLGCNITSHLIMNGTYIYIHTQNRFTYLWILSGTTRVSRYQKKHSPTHTFCGQSFLICFLHLLWSMASSLFNLRAQQSFSTISLQVFFGLPLGLAPSTSYSITCFAVVPRLLHYNCNRFTVPWTVSGTTWVNRYQKGKTRKVNQSEFTGARDSEWQWHQLGICKSASRPRQITMPAFHHSVFLQAGCPSCRPTNSISLLFLLSLHCHC